MFVTCWPMNFFAHLSNSTNAVIATVEFCFMGTLKHNPKAMDAMDLFMLICK